MPTCDNCGSFVSSDWERCYSIDGEIPVCPHCPDRTLDPDAGGVYTEYLQNRTASQNRGAKGARFDPEYAQALVDGGED